MIILSLTAITLVGLGFVIGFIIGKAYQIQKNDDSRKVKRIRKYIDSDLKFEIIHSGGGKERV